MSNLNKIKYTHSMQKNKPSEKKIHTNQILLFLLLLLLRTNQMWSKTDLFIQKHSKTEKENKRSDTQTQKYATTRNRVRNRVRGRERERVKKDGEKRTKKNLHTKFILDTQSNQNKKCIQPQKSCALLLLLLLFLLFRCFWCYSLTLSSHRTLRWNETKIVAKWFIMWNLVFCVRVRVYVSVYITIISVHIRICGYEYVGWSNVWNFLLVIGIVAFFLLLLLWMGKVGKLCTYIVLDKHGGRFEISSFWLFYFPFECVCELFFCIWLFPSHLLSSSSSLIYYYYNYYYYYNLLHNPNRNVSFRWMPMLDLSKFFAIILISFHSNWLVWYCCWCCYCCCCFLCSHRSFIFVSF